MVKDIAEKYRGRGFKLTPQRLAILKFLEGNTSHPSAEDIFTEIKKGHPTVSFATVYNTLQTLGNMGEIQEITINPERKHYDPDPSLHHHTICTRCNGIGDVFEDYTGELQLPDEVGESFTLTGTHVNFYGVCEECSDNKEQ